MITQSTDLYGQLENNRIKINEQRDRLIKQGVLIGILVLVLATVFFFHISQYLENNTQCPFSPFSKKSIDKRDFAPEDCAKAISKEYSVKTVDEKYSPVHSYIFLAIAFFTFLLIITVFSLHLVKPKHKDYLLIFLAFIAFFLCFFSSIVPPFLIYLCLAIALAFCTYIMF